jgi:putative flippase GtrA
VIASRPLRFALAGALNTAFGVALYPLLMWTVPGLARHYLAALLLAQAIGLCFGFATHKLGVFRTGAQGAWREFGAFATFYLANYAANWAVLPLLVEAAHIPPVMAQTAFTAVLIAGSWFWHSHVTFRTRGVPR